MTFFTRYLKFDLFKLSPELETKFREDYFHKNIFTFRIALILGCFLYAIFGILDIFSAPSTLYEVWFIRYAVVCPILILNFILSFTDFYKKYLEIIMTFTSFILGFGIVAMIGIAVDFESRLFYYAGLMLVLMWIYGLYRLRFFYATAVCWFIVLSYEIVAIFYQGLLSTPDLRMIFINNNFFFISANIIGMFVSYFLELYSRQDFLMRQIIEDDKKTLDYRVKQRTRQLEKEKKIVSNLLQTKSQFVNQVAHDLRTPLTPISILLPLAKNEVKKGKKKNALEKLDTIENNAKYLGQLVKNTLNISRIDAGTIQLSIAPSSLSDLFHTLIDNNQIFFEKNEIKVINKIKKSLPLVNIDKTRIQELINNLITNSAKFMKDKKELIFDAKKNKNHLEVSIKDSGIGLEKKYLSKIFEEFYKIDSSRHEAAASSGLGLSICKRIIKMHGGNIWAESKGLGKGTTIKFTLPIKRNRI